MRALVMEVDPETGQPDQTGVRFTIATREAVKTYFITEEAAINEAKNLAEKNPRRQFGVFIMQRTFETTKPNFIEKQVTANGEVILK